MNLFLMSDFERNTLQIAGFIFLCGAIPALIRFLGCKIGAFLTIQSDKKAFYDDTAFDKYRLCVEMRDSEKRMLKAALLTKLTLFLLLAVGIFLFSAGTLNFFGLEKKASENLEVVGFFMTLGFFGIYALRFYLSGGWKYAGQVYNSWYKQYLPPDIVVTEHWERWDGGSWEKKSETREDRNAVDNFWIFLRNAFVFIIKLVMAMTYIALYILDDVYIIFRHIVFYKIAEIYYRRKAEKHYTEFVEQVADMDCFKICNSFYKDERLNSIAQKIHKEYVRKTLDCVKNKSENFVVFADSLMENTEYTATRVSKFLGSCSLGGKSIYVYEGNNCRVYVYSVDNPDINNQCDFFAHAFPNTTTDDEYLRKFLDVPDMISYLRFYQYVFLSLAKESLSSDTTVNLYKIDEDAYTIAIISAKLSDIEINPVSEFSEKGENATLTDKDFYTIKCFNTLIEVTAEEPVDAPQQKSDLEIKKIEDGAFSVQITECSENKLKLIEIIRKYSERGVLEIKNMLESAPISVLDAVSENVANDLVSELNEAGAKAEITNTPKDIAEKTIEDRKKNRQSLISVGEEEITDDESLDNSRAQSKTESPIQHAKAKKAPVALVVTSVLLFLGYLGLLGVSIFLRAKELFFPPIIFQATFVVVGLWIVVRIIAKITTFTDSASTGLKIAGGVLLSISNLIAGFILACIPFGIYISSLPHEEIEAFFEPINNHLDSFFNSIDSSFIMPITAIPMIALAILFIVTMALLNKLSPPSKK